MEAVRGDQAIERGQLHELLLEIGDHGRQSRFRERCAHCPLVLIQGAAIAVDGDDVCARAKEIGQRQGEGAGSGSKIGPDPARIRRRNRRPQQAYVVGVVQLLALVVDRGLGELDRNRPARYEQSDRVGPDVEQQVAIEHALHLRHHRFA